MKSIPLAFAVAMLAAGPALAASSNPQQTATQQTQTMQTPAKAGPVVDPDSMKALSQNNLRQQLHEQLAKAGFTSIKIMPSSFYVQAKNKNGDPVAMVIGPDTFTAVTEIGAQNSASAQPTPQKGQGSAQGSTQQPQQNTTTQK
jgi:hypothetical protein